MKDENQSNKENDNVQTPLSVLGGRDSLDAINKALGVEEIKEDEKYQRPTSYKNNAIKNALLGGKSDDQRL